MGFPASDAIWLAMRQRAWGRRLVTSTDELCEPTVHTVAVCMPREIGTAKIARAW